MSVLGRLLDLAASVKGKLEQTHLERRWERLRRLGMHIGEGVNLPPSTTIDVSHCYLISIGDWCGFGGDCHILAHDGQMDEFLDAGRIGRVIIHPHSHIGARSVILAGVEIGPRTIVGANSVVNRSLPPDTVCAGNPAKVICTLDEYLGKHRLKMQERPTFPIDLYDINVLTPERRAELQLAVTDGDAYLVGGHSALLAGRAGMRTTSFALASPDRGNEPNPSTPPASTG